MLIYFSLGQAVYLLCWHGLTKDSNRTQKRVLCFGEALQTQKAWFIFYRLQIIIIELQLKFHHLQKWIRR